METLLELERNPRPRRKGLYVDPVSYTHLDVYKRQPPANAELCLLYIAQRFIFKRTII